MAVFRELVIFVPQKQSFLHIMEVRVINKSHHPLPQYATSDSAGMDLRANLDRPIVLKPGALPGADGTLYRLAARDGGTNPAEERTGLEKRDYRVELTGDD